MEDYYLYGNITLHITFTHYLYDYSHTYTI